jgi:hypothetical protein
MFLTFYISYILYFLHFIFLTLYVSYIVCFLHFLFLKFYVSYIVCFLHYMFLTMYVSYIVCFLHCMFLTFYETYNVNPSYFEYQDSVDTKGDKHSCSGHGLNMLQFLFLRAIEFVDWLNEISAWYMWAVYWIAISLGAFTDIFRCATLRICLGS